MEYQHGFSEMHPDTMYDEVRRRQKAMKVLSILEDCLGPLGRLSHLDIGCSTGFMTRLYSERFGTTVGVDIDRSAIEFASRENRRPNLSFRQVDGMNTGLPSDSFDVVTCTHIYEHVPDPFILVDEIHRVLKLGGACFFAAGNRFVWMEEHYHLPLLSAIPKPMADLYLRVSGKAERYYETHFSYWTLKKLVRRFDVIDYTLKVIRDPERFHATDLVVPDSLKQRIALVALRGAYWLCPTYLWVLKKKPQERGR
jgi:SAM-dependent methyltransferase